MSGINRSSEPFDPIVYDHPEEVTVAAWCPAPTPNVPPTQVHLILPIAAIGSIVVRFKSPASLDQLIDALTQHRAHVFGPRQEKP